MRLLTVNRKFHFGRRRLNSFVSSCQSESAFPWDAHTPIRAWADLIHLPNGVPTRNWEKQVWLGESRAIDVQIWLVLPWGPCDTFREGCRSCRSIVGGRRVGRRSVDGRAGRPISPRSRRFTKGSLKSRTANAMNKTQMCLGIPCVFVLSLISGFSIYSVFAAVSPVEKSDCRPRLHLQMSSGFQTTVIERLLFHRRCAVLHPVTCVLSP